MATGSFNEPFDGGAPLLGARASGPQSGGTPALRKAA
jgi:hypothetical protein